VAEHLNEIINEHKKYWKILEKNNFDIKDKYKKKKIISQNLFYEKMTIM
jgi:hypothetical protein